MHIKELTESISKFVSAQPALFEDPSLVRLFETQMPPVGDWSDPHRPGMLIKGERVGGESGIYFFYSSKGEVLYIGKATKNNLHHRVWDHMKTPTGPEVGWKTFPNHSFSAHDGSQLYSEDVRSGNVYLGLVTVADPDLVSLIEVYLHTVHKKRDGRLPIFNKQIG